MPLIYVNIKSLINVRKASNGGGMINTVLFMAVILRGVWNIVPYRLQQLEMKSRAADPTERLFFFYLLHVFILVMSTTLAEEERLPSIIVRTVANNTRAALGWSWPRCVRGDHWNLHSLNENTKLCSHPSFFSLLLSRHTLSPGSTSL